MSAQTQNHEAEHPAENELQGLPAAIQSALLAHPTWKRVDGDIVVCAGPECPWRKPGGKSTKQAWLKHQTYTLQVAVADWYNDEAQA